MAEQLDGYATPPPKSVGGLKNIDDIFSTAEFDPATAQIERLDLASLDDDYKERPRYAVYLHNILSAEECAALISMSEQREYIMAQVNIGGGKQLAMTEVRNNDRAIIDDAAIAKRIYDRVCAVLTPETEKSFHEWSLSTETWNAVSFNERLRFLRYDPGTYFAPHSDGSYVRNDPTHPRYGEKSIVTAQIYLNQGFEGGATRMMGYDFDPTIGYDVVPRTGSILLFEHNIAHEGSVLVAGRKYTIRTDVMFERLK